MTTLRSHPTSTTRHRSHRRQTAGHGGPAPRTAPGTPSGAVLGDTVRTTVDQQQTVDGHVSASVLHDVLVQAGVNLDANDMSVTVGSPRLLTTNLVTSSDGRTVEREEDIEVRVVIHTRERLSLFVNALAGATVDGATLTLTPRPAAAPSVATTVEHDAATTTSTATQSTGGTP